MADQGGYAASAMEPLEGRMLLSAAPRIEALLVDTRGHVLLNADSPLAPATINAASVMFYKGKQRIAAKVAYSVARDRIVITTGTLAPNTIYKVKLISSLIKGVNKKRLDGEFHGLDQLSGNGVAGGDYLAARRTAPAAVTDALIIDHNSVANVAGLSQTTMDQIASTFNFFFAHASVGGNMIEGLNSLHAGNAARYKLVSAAQDDTPPATTLKGRVYEYDRGNPDWQTKVDDFKTCLDTGWAGKASIVLNKFCYIDPDVTLQYYAISNASGSAMSQLEAAYPGTKFVYATIPLTTDSDTDNVKRNKLNDQLRAWCRTNGKILFDIADIEAHDPSGTQQTFSYAGKTYQKLYDGYSSDGGHLNSDGAERVALGFYAVGAAVLG